MKQQHSICLSFSQQKTLNKDDSNELRGFYDENTSPLAFEYISSLDEVMIETLTKMESTNPRPYPIISSQEGSKRFLLK